MKKKVLATIVVEVEVDESKFTEEFMREFRESFYDFDSIDKHIKHLAQLYARGFAGDGAFDFIEGYGHPREMGIRFTDVRDGNDTEIVE